MTAPSVSVRTALHPGPAPSPARLVGLFVVGLVLFAVDTVRAIVAIVTVVYVVCIAYRGYLFVRSSRSDVLEIVTDEEARAVPDDRFLPIRC